MVSASVAFSSNHPVPASAPCEIRAILTGEEAADFDREYRLMLAEAAETMDLTGVLAMLTRWQRVAWSRADDPEAHQRMLNQAERLNAGRPVVT